MNPVWQLDLDLFRLIHVDLHRDWLDPVFWVISSTGLGWLQALLVLIIPVVAEGRKNLRLQSGSRGGLRLLFGATVASWRNPIYAVVPMLATLAISGLAFAQGIKKLAIERDRPSNLSFARPQETFFSDSFPSGHTSTSFALAFMLWYLTRQTEYAWVGKYGFIWASLVGLSRIYRGVHWPSDVLGGMFAGLLAASIVYLLMRKMGKLAHLDEAENPQSQKASPCLQGEGQGGGPS